LVVLCRSLVLRSEHSQDAGLRKGGAWLPFFVAGILPPLFNRFWFDASSGLLEARHKSRRVIEP
jgi:hypothetical protein